MSQNSTAKSPARLVSMRRGFTLAEVIIAASLAMLVGGILVGLIIPSMKQTVRGSLQTALGQEALLLFDKLEADLRICSPPSVTFLTGSATNPSWLYAGKLYGVSAQGQQRWSRVTKEPNTSVAYRFRPGQNVVPTDPEKSTVVSRGASAETPTPSWQKPKALEIATAFKDDPQKNRDLAPHLKALKWEEIKDKGCFTLRMEFQRDDLQGKPLRLTIERTFVPRNSLRTSE